MDEPARPLTLPYAPDGPPGTPWRTAAEELDAADTFWLTTLGPGGRAHVVPVLAVVLDGRLHVAAGPETQKARNLARDRRGVIAAHGDRLDLVVHGTMRRVDDDGDLRAVASAYTASYGWEVEVADGALHGDGAPTAGPPPYHVHRMEPQQVLGFPLSDEVTATRWVFT